MGSLEASDLLLADGPGGVDAGLEAGPDGVVLCLCSVQLALLGGWRGGGGPSSLVVLGWHVEQDEAGERRPQNQAASEATGERPPVGENRGDEGTIVGGGDEAGRGVGCCGFGGAQRRGSEERGSCCGWASQADGIVAANLELRQDGNPRA